MTLILETFSFIAEASAQTVAPTDLAEVPISTVIKIVLWSIGGWGASSLPQINNWLKGTSELRIRILHGLWVSLFAGTVLFFTSRVAGQSVIVALLAAGSGGYLGSEALARLYNRRGDGCE